MYEIKSNKTMLHVFEMKYCFRCTSCGFFLLCCFPFNKIFISTMLISGPYIALRVNCQIVSLRVIAQCIIMGWEMNSVANAMSEYYASVSFVDVDKCWWRSSYYSLSAIALSHSLRRNAANKIELLEHIFAQIIRHIIKHIFHRDEHTFKSKDRKLVCVKP